MRILRNDTPDGLSEGNKAACRADSCIDLGRCRVVSKAHHHSIILVRPVSNTYSWRILTFHAGWGSTDKTSLSSFA